MRGLQSERGATLVEYALLVALVALVSMGAIDFLGGAAMDQYDSVGGTWATGAPPSTEGGGSGSGPPPPSPDPPPGPSTTVTTSSTTSTTRPPSVASASFGGVRSWSTGWFRWEGSTEVRVSDASGRSLAGARVEVRIAVPGGTTRTTTVTTDGTGVATVEVGPYDDFGSWGGIDRVQVEIVGVVADGGTWDGAMGSVTISAP